LNVLCFLEKHYIIFPCIHIPQADERIKLANNAAARMPPPMGVDIVFYYRLTIFLILKHCLNDMKMRIRHCSR